jgi:hypothetical protein
LREVLSAGHVVAPPQVSAMSHKLPSVDARHTVAAGDAVECVQALLRH